MQITPQQYRLLCPMRKIRRHIRRAAKQCNNQMKINAKATVKVTDTKTGINILRRRLKNRVYLLSAVLDN